MRAVFRGTVKKHTTTRDQKENYHNRGTLCMSVVFTNSNSVQQDWKTLHNPSNRQVQYVMECFHIVIATNNYETTTENHLQKI